MKILVDENIPATTVTELREQGHDYWISGERATKACPTKNFGKKLLSKNGF